MAAEREASSPGEQVARLYEQAEAQAAKAGESLVGSRGFASMLGQLAENAAVLAKLGNDAMDLALRNLRVAGRRDIVRLARQLARTEDKLERVLQELQELRDQLEQRDQREQRDGRSQAQRTGSTAKAAQGNSRGGRQSARANASSSKERKASS
jgi:TolA-binding protein